MLLHVRLGGWIGREGRKGVVVLLLWVWHKMACLHALAQVFGVGWLFDKWGDVKGE